MKSVFCFALLVMLVSSLRAFAADGSAIGNQLPLAVAGTQQTVGEENLPLYELGVGIGSMYAPDYPGADHSSLWTVPLPFFIYRGDVVRSDKKGGTRARWWLGQKTEFYFSAGGGLPSNSQSGTARAGMPNLEWLGEIGPAMSFHLLEAADGTEIKLNIPFRAAFTTNLKHAAWRGVTLAPYLLIGKPDVYAKNSDIFASVTVDFATEAYMDYFYGVDPQYATSTRESYSARGGYLQTTLTLGTAYSIPKWDVQIFAFTSFDELGGASNTDSPLLRRKSEFTGGVVVAWEFLKGRKKAAIHADDAH